MHINMMKKLKDMDIKMMGLCIGNILYNYV